MKGVDQIQREMVCAGQISSRVVARQRKSRYVRLGVKRSQVRVLSPLLGQPDTGQRHFPARHRHENAWWDATIGILVVGRSSQASASRDGANANESGLLAPGSNFFPRPIPI